MAPGSYASTVATACIPALIPLRNPVMHSDWGSHTHLAQLRGLARSERPEAELWISAHPKAPSIALLAEGEQAVDDLLAHHAHEVLGAGCARMFQDRLPFLLKLLAVEQPLSIQIHPDGAQAAAGWLAEEARGVALSDPWRTFVDRSAKPELFAALKPSQVLCGFLPLPQVLANLEAVGLASLAQSASASQPGDLFTYWLRHADEPLLADAVRTSASALEDTSTRTLIARLVELHPGDPAALAPLFMHVVHLAAGEALAIEPGIVHAALSGFGVEVMASSDNVVRAGLTSKHRDLEVFTELVRTEPFLPPILRAAPDTTGWSRFPTQHAEFELLQARIDETGVDVRGFAALLCVSGNVDVRSDNETVTLGAGEGCLLRDGYRARVSGDGEVFACRVPITQ